MNHIKSNIDETATSLKQLSLAIVDRIDDIAKAHNISFMACLMFVVATLT